MGPPVVSVDAYFYCAFGNVIFGCVSQAISAMQKLNYRTRMYPCHRHRSPPPPSMQFNMEYSGIPSPNKTPRKKNRSSGYSLPFFPVALPPAPVLNLDGLIAGAGRLSQYRIPQQGNEQLCLDNFPDMTSVALLGCDWARVDKCLCSGIGWAISHSMSGGWVYPPPPPHVSDGVGECQPKAGGTWQHVSVRISSSSPCWFASCYYPSSSWQSGNECGIRSIQRL